MSNTTRTGRRKFIKSSSLLVGGIGLAGTIGCTSQSTTVKNKLPKWKGFNLLDFFSPNPNRTRPGTKEEYFKWMSDWGFNFVRIPMAYPSYIKFDRSRDITPDEVYQIDEEATDRIESLVANAHKYNMHVSLNLHRAPGFCVNAGFNEPYNLWLDQELRMLSIITGRCGRRNTKTCHRKRSVLTWPTNHACEKT